MIIFMEKNMINWGFQIILCVFLITYSAVRNDAPSDRGFKRLTYVWSIIIYYTSIVLLAIVTFQFAALPEVTEWFGLDDLANMLPAIIRLNP
jgi:uncharacterized membrane protein YdbT with pleckstrin-like domain